MVRKNEKKQVIDYENSYQKSNQISMAQLNRALTLNQMQLFAYAIFSTQKNDTTQFRKHEFQRKFGIKQYRTEHAYEDSKKISSLQFSIEDLKNDRFSFTNVFSSIEYEGGYFNFEWNKKMLVHILDLKEKYVLTDLTITSKFKSSFSWILYDYLKACYGKWYIALSKDEFMKLFKVESMKSYQTNTSRFKQSVLDVAIKELNEHTELEVWYEEKKVGNKIIGFKVNWSAGDRVAGVTDKQMNLIRDIYDEVEKGMIDYISLKDIKDVEHARGNIIKIREINNQIDEKLTSEKAKKLIWEMKILYNQLQTLLEKDGKDRSVYFNWLNEIE